MTLRRLTIVAPLARYQTLLSTAIGFRALEELDVTFAADNFISIPIHERLLRDVVAPLINHPKHNLRVLAVSSSSSMDLTPLWSALDFFPSLERIKLSIPQSASGLQSPFGLTRLISSHSPTLKHFQWSNCAEAPPIDGAQQPLTRWLTDLQEDTHFLAALETLWLTIPSDGLDICRVYVSRSRDTLNSLSLEGRLLSCEEVEEIVSLFYNTETESRRGPGFLSLDVVAISERLVRVLARMPSSLCSLRLRSMGAPITNVRASFLRAPHLPASF